MFGVPNALGGLMGIVAIGFNGARPKRRLFGGWLAAFRPVSHRQSLQCGPWNSQNGNADIYGAWVMH
jgi:hypothetical protein